MKILSLINHHNSFTILTLCKLLSSKYNDIEYHSVTHKKFYLRFKSSFLKHNVEPILIDSNKIINYKKKEYRKNNKTHKNSKEIKNKFIFKLFIKLKQIVINSSIYLFLREKYITLKMNYFKKKALKILKSIKPDILLSINDRTYAYSIIYKIF